MAAGLGLGGGEAGGDAEAGSGLGELRDGGARGIVIDEGDGKLAEIGFVAEGRLQGEIGNDKGGEHQAILTMRSVAE